MITFTGTRKNRPQLAMDAKTEADNRGCFPKWVIEAMETPKSKPAIRLDGDDLVVGKRRLTFGQSFDKSDVGS